MQKYEPNIDLIQAYEQLLDNTNILADTSQRQAIEHLNPIYRYLIKPKQKSWYFSKQFINKPKGVYLWGEVGSGKTWIMDFFYNALPIEKKYRVHFHHFLKEVHTQLMSFRGNINPISLVAKALIEQYRIICFDEFFIKNVADAMILGELFQILLQSEIILVFTSNAQPSQIYKNGLNRDRITPMLRLLEQHCVILPVGLGIDYRRYHTSETTAKLHFPNSPSNMIWLQEQFDSLNKEGTFSTQSLIINSRKLSIIKATQTLLWCDFDSLCRDARSPADYIELANRFMVFFISNIPPLNDRLIDPTRRFIYLVDELYDRKKQVFIMAERSLEQLYVGEEMAFEFQRTQSRLYEMCFNSH